MRPFSSAALALAAASLACTANHATPGSRASGGPAPAIAASGAAPPTLRLPREVRPVHYALELEVDPDADAFRGTVAIEVALERATSTIWLHARGLRVSRASADAAGGSVAAKLEQVNADGLARLELAAPVGPGRATLRLAWEAAWGEGRGLYRARSAGAWYAASQLEAIAAR